MIFYSLIVRNKVVDSADKYVGEVVDVLIKSGADKEFPEIFGLTVALHKSKDRKFLQSSSVASWGPGEISLKSPAEDCLKPLPAKEKVVSLRKQIVDKQIVDLRGMRVVRVNDLQLGIVQDSLRIMAIDISTAGLLRRLGLVKFGGNRIVPKNVVQWKNVRLLNGQLQLQIAAGDLVRHHPADIANLIEKMNLSQSQSLLQSLDQSMAARVLEEVRPDIKKTLVQKLGAKNLAGLISNMSVDELVDLIQLVPGLEFDDVIERLPQDAKINKVKKILQYDEDTAGGLMTTEYVTSSPKWTVAETIEEIRKVSHLFHSLHFVYVCGEDEKLMGIVSLRTLIVSEPSQSIEQIMTKRTKISTVNVNQSLKSIAVLMTKYNLMSVAVLDKDSRLLGVVTVDDIMRRLLPDA